MRTPLEIRNAVLGVLGAVVGTCAFIWVGYVWSESRADGSDSPSPVATAAQSPPLGSLQYVEAVMQIDISNSKHEMAGQIKVEIGNESDKLIYFHANTAGNINGVAFNNDKVEFDGYVAPRQSTYLLSRRLTGLTASNRNAIELPSVKGIFEYDLRYRFADSKEFSRRTAKGLEIDSWIPIERKPPGTEIVKPTTVRLYNEIEE
jgi:hypothetical protein